MYTPNFDLPGDLSVLWPDPHAGPCWINTRWIVAGERFEGVDVQVRSQREPNEDQLDAIPAWNATPAAPGLDSSVWRKVPIPTILRDFRRYLVDVDNPDVGTTAGSTPERVRLLAQQRAAAMQTVAPPKALPLDVYADAARVYGAAMKDDKPPTRAVQFHTGLSDSGAEKRVRGACRRELFPATKQGQKKSEEA